VHLNDLTMPQKGECTFHSLALTPKDCEIPVDMCRAVFHLTPIHDLHLISTQQRDGPGLYLHPETIVIRHSHTG
jgi:hypothetical protein